MDVKQLIGETTEYEKKQAVEKRKVKNWLKSVSAFSNTRGGLLVFGIADDDDDELIGLENIKKDSEFISQKIKERIDPIPQTNMQIKQVDGKMILLLEIFKGEDTPYYYLGEGGMIAYIRVGNESISANATELKRMVLKGKNSSFDASSTTYKLEDYSFSKLRERFKQWTGNSLEEKRFDSFGMIDKYNYLTNAGALLADESPIYQNRLFCVRWNGLTKAGGVIDALDSAEYSGGLISLLRDGESFIRRNTKTMWRKTPFSRIEMPEYVFQSASEALVNGLIHRDYLVIGSEVHIDIFDNRMEIYSPGGMINGSLIQDLDILHVSSSRRNATLADIFNRLGLMERQGSGLSKIVEGYEFVNNYTLAKKPTFYSDNTQFKAILPNLNYNIEGNDTNIEGNSEENEGNSIRNEGNDERTGGINEKKYKLNRSEEKLLSLIKMNQRVTQIQLMQLSSLSISSIQRITSSLQKKGYLARIGGTRGSWKIL